MKIIHQICDHSVVTELPLTSCRYANSSENITKFTHNVCPNLRHP